MPIKYARHRILCDLFILHCYAHANTQLVDKTTIIDYKEANVQCRFYGFFFVVIHSRYYNTCVSSKAQITLQRLPRLVADLSADFIFLRENEIGRQIRDKSATSAFHVPVGKLRGSRCNVIWDLLGTASIIISMVYDDPKNRKYGIGRYRLFVVNDAGFIHGFWVVIHRRYL